MAGGDYRQRVPVEGPREVRTLAASFNEMAGQVAAAQHASAINSVNEKIALIGVRAAELSLAKQRLADAVTEAETVDAES